MTPDEQREYDAAEARAWDEYVTRHARVSSRLRALGLEGDSLVELASAAADRLERMGALGRIGTP